MANTYTYSGPGTRWAEGDPTSEDKLNIARINVDHVHEALNLLMDTDAATATLLNGVIATTQSAGDNSTKLATTAYVDAAAASSSFGNGTAALPSIYATADTNTGAWFPAADTFAISTAGVERIRFDSSGNVGIGAASAGNKLEITQATAALAIGCNLTSATASGMQFSYPSHTPDNNSQYFLYGVDATAGRVFMYSDGDLANHDGTYGTISDVKFKQDIIDARSYWDDFKALQYRKFRHKSDVEADPNAPYRLGLVAQEVELIFPGIVPESPDPDIVEQVAVLDEAGNPTYTEKTVIVDGKPVVEQIPIMETITTPSGTTHKWVKSSIIEGPIMARIVQELQARVEALEAA